jgi:transposase
MPLPIRRIALRRGDRGQLERLVRARTTAQRVVERAQIVLASADGTAGNAICAQLGISRPTVSRWLDRYDAEGVAGLTTDHARPGRPKQITVTDEAAIIARTLETAPPRGTHWSTRLMATATGHHHATIARIWQAHGLKPHRVKQFKLSTDSQFVEKLREVVGLYLHPPERAVVFSFDEKSQIQALDRTQPGLPMKKGRAGTMTHDYKRHGTTTLFAALDVATGKIQQQCLPQHRHEEFLVFLKHMVRSVPKDLAIHVILDNYATHKHANVKKWLARNRRVHFHCTPTSASWLNLVERFFGELTQRQIRRLAVTSVDQLITTITQYIDRRNENPQPFVWTATVRQILKKVGKANATLATLH